MPPRATYRLQLHKDFGFDQAAGLVPYLKRLGVSHLYASPYLKARPGSTHGYDIVDHNALNPELGDRDAFHRMTSALRNAGLKQILDFVPNHMGVGGADNPLWLDVLEWGPDSSRAGWLDVDWNPDEGYLHDKLLIPFLGDQYGTVLEAGHLRLKFDADDGSFAVWAYDTHKLPICPLHYARILGDAHPELERIGDLFGGLRDWRPQVGRRAAELKAELASLARERGDVRAAIDTAVSQLNGQAGALDTWRGLDALIGNQYWRAAHFRVASDDINYRRFFNINDLAGIRMELPDVFDYTHRLVFDLMKDGTLDGLRIDHIDGLLDPKGYLQRLRDKAGDAFYLIVEKILARHEALRDDWPVDGTTGYDFTNLVMGILIDPAGEEDFTRIYQDFTGNRSAFNDIVRNCKLRIMRYEMASELHVLSRDITRVAHQNPKTVDFTRNILRRALRAIVACFPVYRTYVDDECRPAESDRRDLNEAVAQARHLESDIDPSVFDFLARLLSGDLVAAPRSGFSRRAVLRCAMKLQQYSGPVMAKGLEDTAFYRYNRFIALNEVGGYPDSFGISLTAFHEANQHRARHWPNSMLGTSTHDTKRGEDSRCRLAVLSENASEWNETVGRWSRTLGTSGTAPDRNDEYLFYQMLVGSWPVELLDQPDADKQLYIDRIKGALTKSMREAKFHSTWAAPNRTYEEAVLTFAERALHDRDFLAQFLPYAGRIARLGAINSFAQTVLKLTLPGVPDIYQGSELWDLSLVDPDNRRPVDYALRQRLLDEIEPALGQHSADALRMYMRNWQDAKFKLATIVLLLKLRNDLPDLFAAGDYQAIHADGRDADSVCAFIRRRDTAALAVAVARFPGRRDGPGPFASVSLPPGQWLCALRKQTFDVKGPLDLRPILDEIPGVVLIRQS